MTVSSCKDCGEIRSGNRNHRAFRQTGLQFPGPNCSSLVFFRGKDRPCSFPWGQCCCRPRREGTQSSCSTNEKMAPASDWKVPWWHETAALTAFCPIIHQHLPPTEPVKGCLRLFVVLQEVSSRVLLLHSRLGFLSHLASAMSSERRFHLQALCHEGRKQPATSVLCRDDDTACLHACSLTVCYAFVAHTEKAYWLPLLRKNTQEKNNSLFLPWICCSWVLTWIQIGILRGSTLAWPMGMDSMLLAIQLCMEEMNTSFSLCSLQSSSPRDSHHGQEDSKCCCSFFFMPGSYFLWKTLLISMLQLSTLHRRKGRKEALLPMRVSCMWHSPITDLLRNWHDLPMDIR